MICPLATAGHLRRWLGVALVWVGGCDPHAFDPPRVDAGNASDAGVAVRPLVTAVAEVADAGLDAGVASAADGGVGDAGAVPLPLPAPFEASEVVRGEDIDAAQRAPSGVSLQARWVLPGLAGPAAGGSSHGEAIARLRDEMAGAWSIALWARGRMRVDFSSRGLPFTRGSALLARRDRYGHLLLWPNARAYRVLTPGTLRTALGELRADSTPLGSPVPKPLKAGKRLGMTTRRLSLRSVYGEVRIALAVMPEAGLAGPLLCRTLLEIAGVAPSSEACIRDEVPLAASYRWGGGEERPVGIRFEVTEIRKQLTRAVRRFAMVPRGSRHRSSGLPHRSPLLSRADQRELRTEATATDDPPPPRAPAAGVEARNGSDALMWLFVDGLPAATVPPWQTVTLAGLRAGRYQLQWRSYLGETVTDGRVVQLPNRTFFGERPEADKPPIEGPSDAGAAKP